MAEREHVDPDCKPKNSVYCAHCKASIVKQSRKCLNCCRSYHPGCIKQKTGVAFAQEDDVMCCAGVNVTADVSSVELPVTIPRQVQEELDEALATKDDVPALLKMFIRELQSLKQHQQRTTYIGRVLKLKR